MVSMIFPALPGRRSIGAIAKVVAELNGMESLVRCPRFLVISLACGASMA